MRMIWARLLWNFDLKREKGYENWVEEQRNYFIFEKGPLLFTLVPIRGSREQQSNQIWDVCQPAVIRTATPAKLGTEDVQLFHG